MNENTTQCPDARTTCTGCPFKYNEEFCGYFAMDISEVPEYIQKNNVAEKEGTERATYKKLADSIEKILIWSDYDYCYVPHNDLKVIIEDFIAQNK